MCLLQSSSVHKMVTWVSSSRKERREKEKGNIAHISHATSSRKHTYVVKDPLIERRVRTSWSLHWNNFMLIIEIVNILQHYLTVSTDYVYMHNSVYKVRYYFHTMKKEHMHTFEQRKYTQEKFYYRST